MSEQTMLTGMLPAVVLIASLLSLPISLLLLSWYRRAVQKGMNTASGSEEPATHDPRLVASGHAPELRIEALPLRKEETESLTLRRAVEQPWRVASVYLIGGLSYSVVMTIGFLLSAQETVTVFARTALVLWTYLWPSAIAISLIVAFGRARRRLLFAAYFVVLLALMTYALARNAGLTLSSVLVYWVIINGPATVLMLFFLSRPIRAVGPLVLAFMLAVAIGSQTIVYVAERDEAALRGIAGIGFDLGLGAHATFFGMILLGMLIFAMLGWPLLKWIASRYEQKKMSEQSILLDSLWFVFALDQAIPLAFGGSFWILTGVAAFAAYKMVTLCGLALMRRSQANETPRTLLLLRVFALGKRSERFFQTLRRHWPYVGSVSMIAGPDLVTTTIEPHEFLEFVSGRLSRQFIASETDLSSRMAALDTESDFDGRYRVNEFFCRRDTWQRAMERLATQSDAVLMDLRSFRPDNQGCIFEIGRLLDRIDLARVVFITDSTTDRAFLESTFGQLWRNVDATSPNVSVTAPTVRLLEVHTQGEREMRALLRYLLPEQSAARDAAPGYLNKAPSLAR